MTVPLMVLGAALLMLWVERVQPGRRFPRIRGWWPRALFLNALQAGVVFLAGVTWDGWFVEHRLWSGEALGGLAGPFLGYLAITFIYYWWHRARHEIDFLWRWFHQVHHSPERIEVVASFYKHPFELLANGILSSAILYVGIGLTPAMASSAVLLTGLAELFYHWNVRTPHGLGPFFQRPEMHCVHHQKGLHHFNYGDLPLWDILFGTYLNPREWNGACGFGHQQERNLLDMLLGREQNPHQENAS